MLAALGNPWVAYCTAEGRKALIDAINNYYYQHHAQTRT